MFLRNKLRFVCKLTIYDLNNVPYVSGFYYAKWKLKDHYIKGSTAKEIVRSSSVVWNADFMFGIVITVKDGLVQPCVLQLLIKQELDGGKFVDTIGKIEFDLTECRNQLNGRFLLEDSALNSMIRVKIQLELERGDMEQVRNWPILSKIPIANTEMNNANDNVLMIEDTKDTDKEALIDQFFEMNMMNDC